MKLWEEIGFPNLVAGQCYDHFSKLPKTGKPKPNEWVLMAAVIMCTNDVSLDQQLQVISLATGSKCIGRSQMSDKGYIINDSHAEVLARRAFLRFMYNQMQLAHSKRKSILEHDEPSGPNKFRVKSEITFHLFSSNIPCGDAAIFSKDDSTATTNKGTPLCGPSTKRRKLEETTENESSENKSMGSSLPDIYRTGAKCVGLGIQDLLLPGVDYHRTGALRTKPGRGDRTMSMSCSDKIAKWNVVGIQGALITHFIEEPIYFTSITIGSGPYCATALKRALINRASSIENLQPGYRCNVPWLLQSTIEFSHGKEAIQRLFGSVNPSPTSIIWSKVMEDSLEVSVDGYRQGTTKKTKTTPRARCFVSRYKLFEAFHQCLNEINRDDNSRKRTSKTYGCFKSEATKYQRSKATFLKVFDTWLEKPSELLNFCLK